MYIKRKNIKVQLPFPNDNQFGIRLQNVIH